MPPDHLPSDRAQRRLALAGEIAGIVLEEGLEVLALRGLAARLGTSARMLVYYFGTRDDLVTAALAQIVQRLQGLLASRSQGPRVSPGQFLENVLALSRDPEAAPFLRVLTELVARAARGEQPYDRLAGTLVASWLAWIDSRLVGPATPGRAAAMLGIVEGMTLLDMAAPGATDAAVPFLLQLFGSPKTSDGV